MSRSSTYDVAFGKFFARLAADGITKDNTLFIVAPDENDHFVGGTPDSRRIATASTFPAPMLA